MVKKVKRKSKRKTSKKPRKRSKPRITQTASEVKVEKILVQNFVSLQKVLVNLSVKMDNLTNKISKLLELFEISAKALAEKDFDLQKPKEDKDSKKIMEKIDKLFDQNKTIARGLTLIHEKGPEQSLGVKEDYEPKSNMGGYQKSISSETPKHDKFP